MSITLIGEQTPSFPTSFNGRLQRFDPDLLVAWHKPPTNKPGRWKIEQCTRHHAGYENGRPLHDHTCKREYIMMCQDDEGTPRPLGDWVFDELRRMSTIWHERGGNTERGIRNALAESNAIDQQLEAKREEKREEIMRFNRKDNRVQFNKLLSLVERHDLRPNR